MGRRKGTRFGGLEPIGAVHRTQVGREATEPMREDIRLLGAIPQGLAYRALESLLYEPVEVLA